ncbi:MAG: Hsp70 family protein [Myxococcales bacterium]|nr:Hsp70 family protein [Myxococcales bacterium]
MSALVIDLGARFARVAYRKQDGEFALLTTPTGATISSLVEFGDGEQAVRVGNVLGFCAGQVEGQDERWFGGNGTLDVESAGVGDLRISLSNKNAPISFLMACLFHHIKELAQIAPDYDEDGPGEVVLVVPWWLDAAGRRALVEGAAAVGLTTVRLVTAGMALALACETQPVATGDEPSAVRHVVVCDLGTSRSDFAILRVSRDGYDVLAVASEDVCGAAQSELVVHQLTRELLHAHGVTLGADWQTRARLFDEAERVRLALLTEVETEVALNQFMPAHARRGDHGGGEAGVIRMIRRDEYQLWAAPLVRRLDVACGDLLSQVMLPANSIDAVWVSGSFATMGGVTERLAQLFGKEPQLVASAEAAVIGAARLFDDVPPTVIEVAGSAIALKTGSDAPHWMIASDVGLPWRENRIITGVQGEPDVVFEVWAGDAYSDGRCIGRYLANLSTDVATAKPLLLVDLTLDIDGQLRLLARDLLSGDRVPLRSVQDMVSDRVAIKELLQRTFATADEPSP